MLSSHLHKKGLLTVCLIILTETITLSNAVQFWSTYTNWSNRYGRGSGFESSNHHSNQHQEDQDKHRSSFFSKKLTTPFAQRVTAFQECSSTVGGGGVDSKICKKSNSKSKSNINLHPRKVSRIASGTRSCSNAMYDCCKNNTPQCIALDIRGGHGSHSHMPTLGGGGDTAASSAAEAMANVLLPTPYNIPLNMWKVIFQIFLTAMNVACWLIPLRAKKMTENKLALSIANAFSGGVFLSLAFGHLIPECVHGFKGMNEALPYMIVLGGYLLIFFVEKVAFDAHGLMHDCGDHGHDHEKKKKESDDNDDVDNAAGTGRSAVILLGALAVHSILEMTALGLARSFGDSALLTLSIALHQPAESIALLVAFLKSGMPKNEIVKYLSVFSAMGPIGVAIGMAVTEFAAPIVDSIMLATVAGTFIYVGATEVIPEEWEDQDHKWTKFFALMSGLISIFGITQYTMTLEGHVD